MAPLSSITWSEIFELARDLGAKKVQIGNKDVKIAQFVAQRMYTYRPWQFSLKNAPINSIPLVNFQQDYPAPSDMYDMTQCWITVTYPRPDGQPFNPLDSAGGGSPDQNWNMTVVKNLTPDFNPTGFYGGGVASYMQQFGIVRLGQAIQPPTPSSPSFLNMEYQPKMQKITDMGMTLPFPDYYSQIAVDGCLYWLYKFGDDERAGTTIKQGNAVEYTGQLGVFENSLMVTAAQEESSEVGTFFPSDPIGHNWNWGPYPYIWVS